MRSPRDGSVEALACGGSCGGGDLYDAAGSGNAFLDRCPRAALQGVGSFDAIGSAEDRREADEPVAAGLGNGIDFVGAGGIIRIRPRRELLGVGHAVAIRVSAVGGVAANLRGAPPITMQPCCTAFRQFAFFREPKTETLEAPKASLAQTEGKQWQKQKTPQKSED